MLTMIKESIHNNLRQESVHRFSLSIAKELYERVSRTADERQVTTTALIRWCLDFKQRIEAVLSEEGVESILVGTVPLTPGLILDQETSKKEFTMRVIPLPKEQLGKIKAQVAARHVSEYISEALVLGLEVIRLAQKQRLPSYPHGIEVKVGKRDFLVIVPA